MFEVKNLTWYRYIFILLLYSTILLLTSWGLYNVLQLQRSDMYPC